MTSTRERVFLYCVVGFLLVALAVVAMVTWRGAVAHSVCADPSGALTRAARLAEMAAVDCEPPR